MISLHKSKAIKGKKVYYYLGNKRISKDKYFNKLKKKKSKNEKTATSKNEKNATTNNANRNNKNSKKATSKQIKGSLFESDKKQKSPYGITRRIKLNKDKFDNLTAKDFKKIEKKLKGDKFYIVATYKIKYYNNETGKSFTDKTIHRYYTNYLETDFENYFNELNNFSIYLAEQNFSGTLMDSNSDLEIEGINVISYELCRTLQINKEVVKTKRKKK